MAKRYRSIRKEQKLMNGKIHFVNHLFPQSILPMCGDEQLCNYIETRPGFGTIFKVVDADGSDLRVNSSAVPDDASADDMERAVRKLQGMGLNINPSFLKTESEGEAASVSDDESSKPPRELPTKTSVRFAKKAELQEMLVKYGWDDIDKDAPNDFLRTAIASKIDTELGRI